MAYTHKEEKDFRKYAGWYASYLDPNSGALIDLLVDKVKQYDELKTLILGEIELTEHPREMSPEVILTSVKTLLEGQEPLQTETSTYIWTEKTKV